VKLKVRVGKMVEETPMTGETSAIATLHAEAYKFKQDGYTVIWNRGGRGFDVLFNNNVYCSIWVA
jgi:hypothetical protein